MVFAPDYGKKYIDSIETHYIANSGSDENKTYTGGKAGDQTGHEAELKKWYKRPWSVVLRYPDQAVGLTIAQEGVAMCLNDKVGYDQNQRTTYWRELQAAGYDPRKITVACEEDCTAGVSANVRAAGYIHGIKALQDVPICTSRNMRAQFVKAGFVALTASKYLNGPDYLLPGDILLYESHHAAINVTLGSKVKGQWNPTEAATAEAAKDGIDAEVDEFDGVDDDYEGVEAVITGSSVNVRAFPNTDDAPLGQVKKGDRLPCCGKSFDEEWLFVVFNHRIACVSAKYTAAE